MTLSCRNCGADLQHTFVDLGASPLANSYVDASAVDMEPFYPLHVFICERCFLVQLPAVTRAESIFGDYAYFSSYSKSVLDHARDYVAMVVDRFNLDQRHQVVELASNDGYLLQYFMERGIPVLGVEPAANVAQVAVAAGIPTRSVFFGVEAARALVAEGVRADLIVGNNVLAHVPDLHDFVGGQRILLKEGGVITLEFPHLKQMMDKNYFDTIYHEHFSYFSLYAVRDVLARHRLTLFDVDEIAPQGGSLRIYACHEGDVSKPVMASVDALLEAELRDGVTSLERYRGFAEQVRRSKRDLLRFLIATKEAGKSVVGYGAPAKGNTLLNFCGVRTDFLDYTVDRNPLKQGRLLPGTRIPIRAPEAILETRPDYVLILPWNIKDEIVEQMAVIREWGGRFVVPLPAVALLD
jgi:SAM-dependent methyltransferase